MSVRLNDVTGSARSLKGADFLQRSLKSSALVPIAPPQEGSQQNPYLDAQLVDIGLLERAERNVSSWRRAFFGAAAVVLMTMVLSLILATKSHVEALIYSPDKNGALMLVGLSARSLSPSQMAVNHQLQLWLEAVRDIPGDTELIQRNANIALAMTGRNTQAFNDYRNFVIKENPITASRHGIRRLVEKVEVDQLTPLTYRLAWTESLRPSPDAEPIMSSYNGTVTLAGPPQVPTNADIGQLNPAGVYLDSFNMRWSLLNP
ncbi:MAG TPA: type IV secretion system protein [Candidatus Baltobacteraceae bacterium]|jgi:type IV secretory pathway TrbF-like protein|nr:type IV secretion system protein [Candidatus Baltobacteraceae bacterium]